MYITRAESFALFDDMLCDILRARAREERDKLGVRVFNALVCPTLSSSSSVNTVLEPCSLWMWNQRMMQGLELIGFGRQMKHYLARLVSPDRHDCYQDSF